MDLPETIYPFGESPFPCLNPAAAYFGQPINEIRFGKAHSLNKIIGTFHCSCGFAYRRYDWDEEGLRKNEYDYIYAYGKVFHNKILNLRKKGMSGKRIAEFLGLINGTINSQLKILRADKFTGDKHSSKSKIVEDKNIKASYRAEWLDLQVKNPSLGRTKLSGINRKIYKWLKRDDSDWFEKNSPDRQIVRKKPNRVDWAERDVELAERADELARQLLNSLEYPVQITVTGVAKRLKVAYLVSKRPNCIPKTIEILRKNAESTEEFIARRIQYVTKCFIEEKSSAAPWQVLNRAKVSKPRLLILPKVQEAIRISTEKLEGNKASGWLTL